MSSYPIPKYVPDAEVANRQGLTVTIVCPLCGSYHHHNIREEGSTRTAWRVAACGLYAPVNRDDRARGYKFKESV